MKFVRIGDLSVSVGSLPALLGGISTAVLTELSIR